MTDNEVAALRRQVAAARRLLVQQLNDGNWGTEDLKDALEKAGMAPFGSAFQREVTVTFMIGFEDEAEASRASSDDLNGAVESMFEYIESDSLDFTVPVTDEYEVSLSPIRRGNLPS